MNGNASDYDLVTAETLSEALTYVAGGRRPIAGGTDLMVLFEAGRLPFRSLVNVSKLAELRRIELTAEHVYIGAGVTYSEIRGHPVLNRELSLLCQAAGWTGGIANQNRGTLGGNIANASPAADSAPVLLVYDAEVELTSTRGARWVSYATFHTGYKAMGMQADELITRVRCPRPQGAWIEHGRKVGARKAQAISKLSFAARATMGPGGVEAIRIALGSVAPAPLRCRKTERVLTGSRLSQETRKSALAVLTSELSPIDDIRSTAEYRRQVAGNLLGEFLDLLHPQSTLARWNELPAGDASEEIRKCCGSHRWAQQMAGERPFADSEALFLAADSKWEGLGLEDRMEAFKSHPKIGQGRASGWASAEQSGMNSASEKLRGAMADANREYDLKFGFLYIVCATGKSAEELLEILQRRLKNNLAGELREASEQQRQIMQLRLRKWLAA